MFKQNIMLALSVIKRPNFLVTPESTYIALTLYLGYL